MSKLTMVRSKLAAPLEANGLSIDYESLMVRCGDAASLAVRNVVYVGLEAGEVALINERMGIIWDVSGGICDLKDLTESGVREDEVYVVRVPDEIEAALALGGMTKLNHNGAQRILCKGQVNGYTQEPTASCVPRYTPINRHRSPDSSRYFDLQVA
jgi:hypothetical protein